MRLIGEYPKVKAYYLANYPIKDNVKERIRSHVRHHLVWPVMRDIDQFVDDLYDMGDTE